MDEKSSVALLQAMSMVWSKIRELHPDVPGVVLLAAPAPRRQLNVLGHFAALRWSARQTDGVRQHEVVVVAEHLDRPAEDTVETLIHEAGHAMCFARGINDCSASQYHNRRYKTAAEQLGLEVIQVKHYGFALTRLPEKTAQIYQEEITALKEVLIHRRRPMLVTGGTAPPPTSGGIDQGGKGGKGGIKSRSRKAICACGFIIRVSRTTIESTVIRCESCGEPFRLA